jgi:hypothetical protein
MKTHKENNPKETLFRKLMNNTGLWMTIILLSYGILFYGIIEYSYTNILAPLFMIPFSIVALATRFYMDSFYKLPSAQKPTTLPDAYAMELNTKRIKAYKLLAERYNIDEGTVRDIFCHGLDWYRTEAEETLKTTLNDK